MVNRRISRGSRAGPLWKDHDDTLEATRDGRDPERTSDFQEERDRYRAPTEIPPGLYSLYPVDSGPSDPTEGSLPFRGFRG